MAKNIKRRKIPIKIKTNEAKKEINDKNKNILNKKKIDKIVGDFKIEMNALEQKRDKIVSKFLEVLKLKHIEEIKKSLKY